MTHRLELPGCKPNNLCLYLKALGILRTLAEQKDASAVGYWVNNSFCLESRLNQNQIIDFFLNEYKPTPIISPWNGSTGFDKKDETKKTDAMDVFRLLKEKKSEQSRFHAYYKVIHTTFAILNRIEKPKSKSKRKEFKAELVSQLRNYWPDEALPWLDSCVSVQADLSLYFPPILGTGGNDGNLDFGRLFLRALYNVIQIETEEPTKLSKPALEAALFDTVQPALVKLSLGQFNPVRGKDEVSSCRSEAFDNPWDCVLALEGVTLFQADATCKYQCNSKNQSVSYPFTFQHSQGGYATIADENTKCELWAPVWSKPMTFVGLKSFFAQARCRIDEYSAETGFDFGLILSKLGSIWNVDKFCRYALLERNGKSVFAVPVQTIYISKKQSRTDLYKDIYPWIRKLRLSDKAKSTERLTQAYFYLEDQILKKAGSEPDFLALLGQIAEMEVLLDGSHPFPKIGICNEERAKVWLKTLTRQNRYPEFRLAYSLAGAPLAQPIRSYLLSVWTKTNLTNNLITLLRKHNLDSFNSEVKEYANPKAVLNDVNLWLAEYIDESKLELSLKALSLIRILSVPQPLRFHVPTSLPPAYRLCAAAYGSTIEIDGVMYPIHCSPTVRLSMLDALARGDAINAIATAIRILRNNSIFLPVLNVWTLPEESRRIAAALAFPLSPQQRGLLLQPFLPLS